MFGAAAAATQRNASCKAALIKAIRYLIAREISRREERRLCELEASDAISCAIFFSGHGQTSRTKQAQRVAYAAK